VIGLQVHQPPQPHLLGGLFHDFANDTLAGGLAGLQAATGQLPHARYCCLARTPGPQDAAMATHHRVRGDPLAPHGEFAGCHHQIWIGTPEMNLGGTRPGRARTDFDGDDDFLAIQARREPVGHLPSPTPQEHPRILAVLHIALHNESPPQCG
jgi:hypothetical protein